MHSLASYHQQTRVQSTPGLYKTHDTSNKFETLDITCLSPTDTSTSYKFHSVIQAPLVPAYQN